MSVSPTVPPDKNAENEARLASARKTTNVMLLGLGGGVIGLIVYGLTRMVLMVLKYS